LEISEQEQITTCVPPSPVPFSNVTSAVGDNSGLTFDVVTAGDTTDSQVVIWATPRLSQGTTFVKNRLRQLEVFAGGDGLAFDIQASYVALFGQPQAGDNIFIGVRVINGNGQASPLETIKALIVA
jgi:hypothetical protein